MSPTEAAQPVLDVVLLPSLVEPEFFEGKTVIVVDVLRATTTITSAIHAGCRYVLPQGAIELARQSHEKFEADPDTKGVSLMGGERNGKIIPGFHNGNSPVEYTPEVIEDKILILATTNGTVAMDRCRLADRVFIGAMVNLTAVAEQVVADPNVVVLCSGTDRLITSEDVIFAGAFVDRVRQLRQEAGQPVGQMTDPAFLALNHWLSVQRQIETGAAEPGLVGEKCGVTGQCDGPIGLDHFFKNARGGINLVKIGHLPDIEFAAKIDQLPVVSELNLKTWQIRRSVGSSA